MAGCIRVFRLLAAALALTSAAWGEPTPVLVEVSVAANIVDAAALRVAIGKELDCPVTVNKDANHSGEIVIRPVAAGQVSVTFVTAERIAPLRRVVALPQTPEHRVQLIAWLVGNMARNEAAEWLSNHQREKEAEMAKAAQSPPSNAPPSEAKPGEASSAKPDAQLKADLSVGNAANKNSQTNSQNLPAKPGSDKSHPGAPEPSRATYVPMPALRYHGFNLALWHRILELHRDSETSRFGFHLGLGYGRVGAIRGFGFDVIHHRSDIEDQGFAGSLLWARVARTQGVAWSLAVVTAEQDVTGVDYAGLVAYRDGNLTGVQSAGLVSYSTGNALGAQMAGIFAWNDGDVTGAQGAFVFTRQAGTLRGFQLSLAANVAGDVTGGQFGAVNVAKNVYGVQFGLVNVAKNVDGVAIGLVNISDNVRTQAELWVERNYLENIGVRYVYSPLTFGVSTGYDSANDRQRYLFGLGARFAYKRFAFAPSVDVGFVIDKIRANPVGRGHENDIRLAFELEVIPKVLGISAGPTLAMRSDSGKHLQPLPRWFAGLNLF